MSNPSSAPGLRVPPGRGAGVTPADPTGLVTESVETLRRELRRHVGAHADIVTNDLMASGAVRPAAEVRAEAWDLRGGSLWLDREQWGVVIDALIQHRGHADQRKAVNSESTSDVRSDMCADLIRLISRAALAEVREDGTVVDKIDASLAACCEGHAKFGICYNDPEDDR